MHFGLNQYLLVNRNDHFMLNIKFIDYLLLNCDR